MIYRDISPKETSNQKKSNLQIIEELPLGKNSHFSCSFIGKREEKSFDQAS